MNASFDPSALLPAIKLTRGAEEANELEAANIERAVAKYLFSPPDEFDFTFLLTLHREMFGEVWQWAGRLRKSNQNFGLPWNQVEEALYNTTLNLPHWSGQPLIEQCARLHHQLVQIHPFENGNGRWSRLSADIWSIKRGGSYFHWPPNLSGPESPIRTQYINALRKADGGDLSDLIAIMRACWTK